MSARSPAATLALLFAIQFLSWAGMFCLWIYAVPVISGDVFHVGESGAGPAKMGAALAVIGGGYALYALLGASLAFVLPRLLARVGVRWVYAPALALAAGGIGAVGMAEGVAVLVPAFAAIGVGWSALSNIPYALVSAIAPEGRGAHLMRVFGFSTVAPQVVVTLALAAIGPRLGAQSVHLVMLAGAALMAAAALLVALFGGGFVVAQEEW